MEHPQEPSAPPVHATATPTDWRGEAKAILWLLAAVFAFQSSIARAFYIPSESMMPGLIKGDHLVASKYAYGWSWASPPLHVLPPFGGRLLGRMPQRGDVVIVSRPDRPEDLIKRVIGLPGDTVRLSQGQLYLNARPVIRERRGTTLIPVDSNIPCLEGGGRFRVTGADGRPYCRLPLVRKTLPGGRSYDTIDLGYSPGDDFGPVKVPPRHVFLMGDNRDDSADSRVALEENGLGGAVPWENLAGRAEFITYSDDGTSTWLNPVSWVRALRGGRAGTSLRPREGAAAR
jgi:signal peptidase I